MKHPNDDELKAYARNSFLNGPAGNDASEMRGIQQHLAVCSHCQERYNPITLAYTESILKAYMRPTASYPSITVHVMQRVQRSQQSNRASGLLGWRYASIPVGIILVGTFLVVVTLIALAQMFQTGAGSSSQLKNTLQGTKAVSVPTLATQSGEPFIAICHRPKEVELKHMDICGHNYTPGSSVELIITMPETAPTMYKTVTVAKDGTIDYVLYVASCKFVPSAITAISGNQRAVITSAQQTIQFGTCPPVSGAVGTPEQRASWSLQSLKQEQRKEK